MDDRRIAARLKELETQNRELKAQLSQIVQSRSWRLTAPLRSASRLWHRIRPWRGDQRPDGVGHVGFPSRTMSATVILNASRTDDEGPNGEHGRPHPPDVKNRDFGCLGACAPNCAGSQ